MATYSMQQIKKKIEDLSVMSDLAEETFSEEDGLADSLVQAFPRDKLKPAQLRKVFHKLRSIESMLKRADADENAFFDRREVVSVVPMLAYACGRQLIPKDFYDLMKLCLSSGRLKTNKDFLRVAKFLEAVMAFHKYRGMYPPR